MATNGDFQQGLQAGAALFAPVVQAQAQANQSRLVQQQELARRLFAQHQLTRQLAAREQASQNDRDARQALQAAQQLFASGEAQKDRESKQAESEAYRDFIFAQNQEKQDQSSRNQQDAITRNTDVASAVFGRLNDTTNQLRDKLTVTDAEREVALSNAIQLTGADAKRTRGEDFSAFFTRVANDNPEVAAQFQVELQGLQEQKVSDPEVLTLQSQGRTLNNIFENVTRGGNFDPSFLFVQGDQAQGAINPNDPLAFVESLNELLSQAGQQQPQPEGGSIPSTPGLLFTAPKAVTEGVGGVIQGLGGLVEDARRGVFGQPEVPESDILDTKKFAESIGVTNQEFDLLSQDEKRELNQRRIKSNVFKQSPKKPSSFVPIFGF